MLRWLYRISDRLRHRLRSGTWTPEHALGRRAEDLAHRYLQNLGLTVVARNFRTPSGSGELDIVAREGDTLIVIEVKSRAGTEFGLPERTADWAKEQRVTRGAEEFARRAEVPLTSVRFDLVTVVFSDPIGIRHFKDVFHPDERKGAASRTAMDPSNTSRRTVLRGVTDEPRATGVT